MSSRKGMLHAREVRVTGVARLGYLPILPHYGVYDLLAISPDGRLVLTGRLDDGYVHEWRVRERL